MWDRNHLSYTFSSVLSMHSKHSVVVVVQSLSHVLFCATPWAVILQAPLPLGFPRQESSSCHFLLQRIFPTQESISATFFFLLVISIVREFKYCVNDFRLNFYSRTLRLQSCNGCELMELCVWWWCQSFPLNCPGWHQLSCNFCFKKSPNSLGPSDLMQRRGRH